MKIRHLVIVAVLAKLCSPGYTCQDNKNGWASCGDVKFMPEIINTVYVSRKARDFIRIPNDAVNMWSHYFSKLDIEDEHPFKAYYTILDRWEYRKKWSFSIVVSTPEYYEFSLLYHTEFTKVLGLMNANHAYQATLRNKFGSIALKAIPLV
ncbi:hypothetical protein AX774_g7050 [Zancudomyces culisetae]|uniref:Uncharacterized protein n=1 Tax=Zancudomyces culisetae TaxID=1213189 RepID=A0A1R1PF52_ZANCU|nr:hypothetical protein AX774_g7050 [Zancudomyces culisetae]|eukprot:OMH79533.1 hypothetical protein AX774_g7050 [Zancudomyces culisetae]